MHPLNLKSLLLLLLLTPGLCGTAMAADEDGRRKPPTQQTQSISAAVFKDLDVAQQAFDDKDYGGALAALDKVRAREDTINDYERATLYNLYAAVYYAQDQPQKAIDSYLGVLRQPKLPEGLRDGTLFALAQMYFVIEDYAKAVTVLDTWFAGVPQPSADAYVLLAQAYYQQQRYAEAETPLLTGLKLASDKGLALRENWLGLLRAVYYELGDIPKAAKVLEILVARFPSESYYLQLSGMYGLMGDQAAQLATLHAAYLGDMISTEADLLNLARLYLVEGAPYPAARLLEKGFRSKRISVNADNLQLYAQTLSIGQDSEAQVPVLEALAALTNDARHYTFLGQALNVLGRWDEAIAAFSKALSAQGLENAAAVRMQLGTAQFNAGQLQAARRSFLAIQDDERVGESASNWVTFVSAEIARREAMHAL